jgi:hypothetical protein
VPLSTEAITNKPLTGPELVTIIEKDVRALLEKDGMFNSHVAFGKVVYQVSVKLTLANPTYPEHVARASAKLVGDKAITPEDEVKKVELTREREIKSPNVARVANGLPVRVMTRQDGHNVEKDLQYKGQVELPDQPEPVDSVKEDK